MLNISEPPKANKPVGFFVNSFELAFRPYFLLASASSIVALAIWLAVLNGVFSLPSSGLNHINWHIHEMLFGYSVGIAVGFILTAVQTWTGQASLSGKPLAGLVVLWCAIRLAIWLNTNTSIMLAIVLQLLWWLWVIATYARLVFKATNRRNYLFIPLLSIMALLNLGLLGADILGNSSLALHLAKSAVLLFTIIMTIVGGRVIPFFTVRGAQTAPIKNNAVLDWLLLAVNITMVALYIASYFYPLANIAAIFMLLAGILHLVRMGAWRSLQTLSVPLLWSLHLSYLMMALGLVLLGASQFVVAITFSAAMHLITIGALGLMTLAMMSRVSLGHTSRMLNPKPIISWAFAMMTISALVRALLVQTINPVLAWNISAALWIAAMMIFLVVYWPILTSPRVDR